MVKPPQDMFRPEPPDPQDEALFPRPSVEIVPRVEIALTVPNGVDLAITVNGVGVLMGDDEGD